MRNLVMRPIQNLQVGDVIHKNGALMTVINLNSQTITVMNVSARNANHVRRYARNRMNAQIPTLNRLDVSNLLNNSNSNSNNAFNMRMPSVTKSSLGSKRISPIF